MANWEKHYLDKFKTKYSKVKSFEKVSKGKPAYKISYSDMGRNSRLDILPLRDNTHKLQEVVWNRGYDIFPEVYNTEIINDRILKVSEWVKGTYYSDLFESNKLELNMFEKLGEQMAQLNNITNEDGWRLHNDDITMRNMLWDGEKAVVFDMDRLWYEENVDNSYVKILLKRLIKIDYIDAFLKGYSVHRDVSNMSRLCAERNWKWKR